MAAISLPSLDTARNKESFKIERKYELQPKNAAQAWFLPPRSIRDERQIDTEKAQKENKKTEEIVTPLRKERRYGWRESVCV
jgi:hypothetical protein